MLLVISKTIESIPNLLSVLKQFSLISGLTVNDSKSLAMNISLPEDTLPSPELSLDHLDPISRNQSDSQTRPALQSKFS